MLESNLVFEMNFIVKIIEKKTLTFSNVDRLDWAFLVACIVNGIPTPDPGGGGGGGGAPEVFRGLLGTVATAVSLSVANVDLFVC